LIAREARSTDLTSNRLPKRPGSQRLGDSERVRSFPRREYACLTGAKRGVEQAM
jgi:hypothetical protein